MTDELSPRAREIVDAAREADGPTEADRLRVRAAVFAAIGVGATTSATQAAAAEAAGESAASAASGTAGPGAFAGAVPMSVKVMAIAAAAAAVGTGGYLLTRSDDPAPQEEPTPVMVESGDRDRAPQPDRNGPAPSLDTPDQPEPEPEPEPEMEFEPDHVQRPSRQPSTISAERELLSHARAMRQSGDAADALKLLDDYTRRFSGGKLLEERSALRVIVLCDLGHAKKATRAATSFLRKWPSSVQAERVRGSCASD